MYLLGLKKSIQSVKGVGPQKLKKLQKINIRTIEDLIYYFPRTYEDRRTVTKIRDCADGGKANIVVTIQETPKVQRPRRKLSITKVLAKDDTGYCTLVWFNQDYIKRQIYVGQVIGVNGNIKRKNGHVEVHNVTYEDIKSEDKKIGSIVPIYPLTDRLSNNEMISLTSKVLEEYSEEVMDILPIDMLEKYQLCSIVEALHNIHFPKDRDSYIQAKRRLVFDEFFILQLGLLLIKTKNAMEMKGIPFDSVKEIDEMIEGLPFKLTEAQIRAFREINEDMESPRQMNRLIQGDVGSGKTIIAALAIYKSVKSGYQAVFMAPTEILAMQQYESMIETFNSHNISVGLLTGSLSKKAKQEVLDNTCNGNIKVLVGTHALIEENVQFKNLGLAITDEQHRFGVRQRALLSEKGKNPDILVMSATPIPRTLALILYGDLDISIINQLPPGRKKIKTYSVSKDYKKRIYDFINKQVAEGRQAYIVCPLVEESESLDLQSAVDLYEELKEDHLKNLRIGLLHGKMKSSEKDQVMYQFKEKLIDVLISTTVIEVGVNVPNANIIVIENAERFGLAQLHQLRGRVGRGKHQSYCILINEGTSKISRERMRIMEQSNDGFVISEKDLELRGPGDFFGTRQHGIPELKVANIFTDMVILKEVQKEANNILKKDPYLKNPKYEKIRQKIKENFQNTTRFI